MAAEHDRRHFLGCADGDLPWQVFSPAVPTLPLRAFGDGRPHLSPAIEEAMVEVVARYESAEAMAWQLHSDALLAEMHGRGDHMRTKRLNLRYREAEAVASAARAVRDAVIGASS